MASPYFRALATCSMLKKQLAAETESREAMELCFQKIHKSLDLYKGHLINRIRFHMNRHHTEYLRKVRLAKKKKAKVTAQSPPRGRRSERISQIDELTAELRQAKDELARKSAEIDELCSMLERVDAPTTHDQSTQTEPC